MLANKEFQTRLAVSSNDTAFRNDSHRAEFSYHALENPFAEGAFRWVAKGEYTIGNRAGQPCVCKWFKSGHVMESRFFAEDIKACKKAIDILTHFNEGGFLQSKIHVNQAEVWTFDEGYDEWSGRKVLQEPFIENYVKWNSNSGWSENYTEWGQLMQAISHFSYHVTGGNHVLCDLQGGFTDDGACVLTDPVVLSRTRSYGITDLGTAGIETFCARHTCNRFCRRAWALPRNAVATIPLQEGTTMTLETI